MTTPLAAIALRVLAKPIAAGLTVLLGATAASAVPLYNGLSIPSQTPAQQGWLYYGTSISPAPSATATTNGTILNTGEIKNYAGYFRQAPFSLDRIAGYTISFDVKINSENHANNNRAGFSIIVMSDALPGESQPYGIELGFWKNSVWAQNVGFTRGENVSYNTSTAVVHYNLYVKGNEYQLFANGSTTPILKGRLRQYTGATLPPGYPNPYTTPNLIFLGDDTTSAQAQVTLTNVYATPAFSVP